MQSTITIEGKLLGKSKPLFADWLIPFPPDLSNNGKRLTLRDLLTRIVIEEVEAFRTRQEQRRLTIKDWKEQRVKSIANLPEALRHVG